MSTPTSGYSKFVDISATGFYSGYFPVASGTAGSAAALVVLAILYYLFPRLVDILPMLVFCVVFTLFAVWIAEEALKLGLYGEGKSDPKQVVIDEYAGYFVTMIGLAPTMTNLVLGFFMFRVFDVLKPPPVRQLERLHGGWGIVLDDVMAGVMANISVRIILAFMGWT